MYSGEVNNTGGERFLDRGSIGISPVTSLVQSDSGGIQINRGNVLANGKLDWVSRTGFCKPIGVVYRFQSFHSCLFDDRLAVRHTVQLGVQSMSFYRKSIVLTDPLFQRQGTDTLKQFFKVVRLELSQLNQNTFCRRQAEICLGNGFGIAAEQNTTVLSCNVSAADFGNFEPQRAFQPKMAGAAKQVR